VVAFLCLRIVAMLKPARLFLPLLAILLAPAVMADTHNSSTDPRIESLLTQLGKVRDIDEVAVSPDGRQLAWVVDTNDKPAIVLADADGQHAHNVGMATKPGACSENGLAWAPDSRHLAFLSNCAGGVSTMGSKQPDIYVLDTQSQGKPTRLSKLNGYVHALSWAPDGKSLAFLYVEGATRRASALAAAKPAIGEIGVEGIEVQRVATLPVQGGTLQVVTPSDSYIYEFSWAPDSQRLTYVAAAPPGDNNWWVAQLYVQAAQVGASRTALVDPNTVNGPLHGLQIALPRWSPDGSRIAFIGGLMSDQGATGGDLYSVSVQGGTPVNLTPGIPVTPAWFSWSSPQSLLVSQISNGQAQVAEYLIQADRAQQQRLLFTAPGYIGSGTAELSLSLSTDHRYIAFAQSSFDSAPEVYAGAVGDHAPVAVTAINAALKPSWGKAQSVEWNNDGFHVQGWLLYPAHYDPSKHYPMIVTIHGGPSSAVIPHWPSAGYGAAPFSALGYFVFMTNPRGSFGEGEAFVTVICATRSPA
jgi:dipeptidyl aminopeptidase/acylaminoacyl peptidase